jgi:hypothetical protein
MHALIHSTATLPVHGGVDVSVVSAFEFEVQWDDVFNEWYISEIIDVYYRVGAFDLANTPPHEFERGDDPEIGVQENGNDMLETLHEVANGQTPNEKETAYAKSLFAFFEGRLKYNTVTTIEAA